ncbi:MAG: hypothetical protein HRT47_13105 [Candidatus Caenarcaniphilales bacterium]|nr:hypothetical protein [Candidatus Caenarcaniphilales bacterium]
MSGLNPSLNTDTVLAKNQASLDFAKQNLENTYQQETDIRESNFLNAFDQNLFDLSENDIEKINLHRTLENNIVNFNLNSNSVDSTVSENDENRSKSQLEKMTMRFARFIDTRPIMKTAIATAIGDDMAATFAGLFRNFSEGVLNFASASEEAFKGVLKFILNISGISVTESLTKAVAKFTLPDHLQEDATHLLLIPYRAFENPEKLPEELEKIQLSEPRDHLNTMRQIPARDEENRLIQVYRAKRVFDFAENFNPSEKDIESIKKFHLAMRFFEGGVKSSLWASVPLLNRVFRSKILGLDSFPGLKGIDGAKEKNSYGPLQKLGAFLSLSSGFIFHGAVLTLNKISKGTNEFAKNIINKTGFSHGVYPTDEMNFINQGLSYDASRLVNSQGKAELFESGLMAGVFSPLLYFGHKFTNFIGVIADKQLAEKHSVERGILVDDTRDIKVNGIKDLINKFLPENHNYKDIMPKVDYDKDLTHDAKVLHGKSTISKLLMHSMIVLGTRIFVNSRTKAFAKAIG